MLHLALSILHSRLTDSLKSVAVNSISHGNKLWLCVIASSFDGLVILDDDSFDVVIGRCAEQVIGVHVVEGGDHNPLRGVFLFVVAVFDESL